MGYGGLPQTPQERELNLEARAADREREMAHVADRLPGEDRPSLFERIVRAIRGRRPRNRC
jgi:hypothetical protein